MNNFALSISQQFPENQFNLLVPMKTVTEIAEIHKPVMNTVQISMNFNDKEVYEQEKASDSYTDKKGFFHAARPAAYALTKKGLNKLMRAAGIKILETKSVVPSICQKCAEVNKSVGRPVNCGACGNKDVKFTCKISVPQLTGESIVIAASKEIIVSDVTAGMSDKQRAEFLKFRSEMCETKAINRALRAAMHIKGTYTAEELRKPFVVAYLVPNLDHEEVRKEAVKHFFESSSELFGNSEHVENVEPSTTVDNGLPYESQPEYPEIEMQTTQPYQMQHEQQPVGVNCCVNCGVAITGSVKNYSTRTYGRALCMTCQKTAGGSRR